MAGGDPSPAAAERLPLLGQGVALTRDHPDDLALFAPLEALGGRLIALPLTHQRPTPDAARLPARLRAGGFTDLVVTSVNSVRGVAAASETEPGALAGVRVWAVGPATARAVGELLGREADLVPEEASGEGIVALAVKLGVAGARFFFPAARGARRTVPEGLVALGATVEELAIYETVPDLGVGARLLAEVAAGLALIVVASPSAVASLAAAMDAGGVARGAVALAVIGPTTRTAAEEHGLRVAVMPARATLPDLVAAIADAALGGALAAPEEAPLLHRNTDGPP